MSIPDGAVQPASGRVPMGSALRGRVAMGRARRGHKARADLLGRVARVMHDRLPKAGDSIRRVSTTVAPSALGRVAEQDAPASEDLVRLVAASAAQDQGHAPAASAGHDRPAVAASAVLVPPGREGSGIRIRAAPVASAGHDQGHAPGASAGHGLPAAGIAISDRVGRVRLGRAMATGRPDRPSGGPMTASPTMKLEVPSARRDVNGDPRKAGLPDRLGRTVISRKLLVLRISKLRGRAPTSDGIPSNVLVRPGRAPVHVPISVADRARSGQALGSGAADHRACRQ
ncbi:MAG TPA: hypothetical protein VF344_06425 [Candidatus Limnocylindrales bacterium]